MGEMNFQSRTGHHPDGPRANDAVIFNMDQPFGADDKQMPLKRAISFFVTILAVFLFSLTVGSLAQSNLKKCPKDQSQRHHNCFGTFIYAIGEKYVGEFRNHKRHGQGAFTFANGNKYVGEWRDDKYYEGKFIYANDDKYVGEFRDNMRRGQGAFTFANGNKYVGAWHDDKYYGQGTFTYANDDEYVGEFRDGKRHGQGTFTFADGSKYIGGWRDDKYYGQGTFYSADGYIREHGIYENDVLVKAEFVEQADEPSDTN